MRKGLSPIIATILLIAIAVAVGSIVSIYVTGHASDYMNKEGERRERILDKEGESLELIHVESAGGNVTLTVQNNGTTDVEVTYVTINETDYNQLSPTTMIDYGESQDITVAFGSTVNSLELGSRLGNIFVFNAPSPRIEIINSFFNADNKLVTFSGEGSTDDGRIVQWAWCFRWDEATDTCLAGCDGSPSAWGYGKVTSYSYIGCSAGTYAVKLVVTDDTGMTGEVLVYVNIP
ncbi:MAG: PKD domain-containing protein [Theionarchaea archaeon]|nr:PKD domain-containing protein [Theionarchaea archaeon]MBU7001424.1 PKD domain-containing protein [Theionarchaea archaeon]MBU7021885.1 PKD domain-containing protein [Theionarchaea archaeon]MBU7034337.1 PKD domain-containing protein [Theionarchaea archaeon]MBU7040302.1 PKD domain-containing protein [Theionarchaea archaeon]